MQGGDGCTAFCTIRSLAIFFLLSIQLNAWALYIYFLLTSCKHVASDDWSGESAPRKGVNRGWAYCGGGSDRAGGSLGEGVHLNNN